MRKDHSSTEPALIPSYEYPMQNLPLKDVYHITNVFVKDQSPQPYDTAAPPGPPFVHQRGVKNLQKLWLRFQS